MVSLKDFACTDQVGFGCSKDVGVDTLIVWSSLRDFLFNGSEIGDCVCVRRMFFIRRCAIRRRSAF